MSRAGSCRGGLHPKWMIGPRKERKGGGSSSSRNRAFFAFKLCIFPWKFDCKTPFAFMFLQRTWLLIISCVLCSLGCSAAPYYPITAWLVKSIYQGASNCDGIPSSEITNSYGKCISFLATDATDSPLAYGRVVALSSDTYRPIVDASGNFQYQEFRYNDSSCSHIVSNATFTQGGVGICDTTTIPGLAYKYELTGGSYKPESKMIQEDNKATGQPRYTGFNIYVDEVSCKTGGMGDGSGLVYSEWSAANVCLKGSRDSSAGSEQFTCMPPGPSTERSSEQLRTSEGLLNMYAKQFKTDDCTGEEAYIPNYPQTEKDCSHQRSTTWNQNGYIETECNVNLGATGAIILVIVSSVCCLFCGFSIFMWKRQRDTEKGALAAQDQVTMRGNIQMPSMAPVMVNGVLMTPSSGGLPPGWVRKVHLGNAVTEKGERTVGMGSSMSRKFKAYEKEYWVNTLTGEVSKTEPQWPGGAAPMQPQQAYPPAPMGGLPPPPQAYSVSSFPPPPQAYPVSSFPLPPGPSPPGPPVDGGVPPPPGPPFDGGVPPPPAPQPM